MKLLSVVVYYYVMIIIVGRTIWTTFTIPSKSDLSMRANVYRMSIVQINFVDHHDLLCYIFQTVTERVQTRIVLSTADMKSLVCALYLIALSVDFIQGES